MGFKESMIGRIPIDWSVMKLSALSNITRLAGAEYSDLWEVDPTGKIIALRGFNIKNNKLNLDEVDRISGELSKRLIRSKLFKNDIVFPCVGTIGKAYRILENDKYHINQNIAKITPNEQIDSHYLTHFLMSEYTMKQILKYNTSSSQPNVLVGNLRKFEVVIPPLPEQKKIAKILSSVDNHIDEVDGMIEDLKELKKGLMQKLLTEGIGHTEFKDSEVGRIPVEWEVVELSKIARICYGKSQKTIEVDDGKYKILGTGGVIGKTNNWLHDEPSVLIGRKGTINKPMYIEEPFWTVDTLFYTIISKEYYPKWFYYAISNINLEIYNEATGVPSLSSANLNRIKFAIPSFTEQLKISEIIESVDKRIQLFIDERSEIFEVKKGLMQQLLTGKKRVVLNE